MHAGYEIRFGNSSLAHLTAFELDRSFIDASYDDATAMALLRAITMTARQMIEAGTGEHRPKRMMRG